MSDLRFPIGECVVPEPITDRHRAGWIDDVAELPRSMRAAVGGLTAGQLDTSYRPGGWTVRQVVHHVPDSHLHAYDRFKLALTEDTPTIKPYDEAKWARLADTQMEPEVSLVFLEALHTRWAAVLRSLAAPDFQRAYIHPEFGRAMTLDEALARYAWHGRHHVAHITSLRQRNGW